MPNGKACRARVFALACAVSTAACGQGQAVHEGTPHARLHVSVIQVGGMKPMGRNYVPPPEPNIPVTVSTSERTRHKTTNAAGRADFDVGTGTFHVSIKPYCPSDKTVTVAPSDRTATVRLRCDVK